MIGLKKVSGVLDQYINLAFSIPPKPCDGGSLGGGCVFSRQLVYSIVAKN
jgi:hypothetical protein